MSTKTITDPSQLPELEFQPPCDRHIRINGKWQRSCENPAEWIGVYGCCGHHFTVCNTHKYSIQNNDHWECLACKAYGVTAIHWERI